MTTFHRRDLPDRKIGGADLIKIDQIDVGCIYFVLAPKMYLGLAHGRQKAELFRCLMLLATPNQMGQAENDQNPSDDNRNRDRNR